MILAYRATIVFFSIGLAAIFVLLLYELPSRPPTHSTPGFDAPFATAPPFAVLVFILARELSHELPLAMGTSTGITATDEGVRCRTPWRRQRFLRWQDARLLEVVPVGKKGGETTKNRQGHEFYARIGKKGGESNRTRMKPKGE